MRKILLSISLMLSTAMSFGQNGNNPPHYFEGPPGDDVFASPDVQAFHEYQMLPEKLYTGKLDLSIPLFTINSGGISVPISLSYDTGGIKVSEVASNVGMGWNLSAGGSILKIVRDLSDDDFYGTGQSEANNDQGGSGSFTWILSQVGYHRQGYPNPYSYFHAPVMHHNTYGHGVIGKLDSSPDFFQVNVPGLNTKFYLEDANPNDNITQFAGRKYKAVFTDNSGVKINHNIQRIAELVPRFTDYTYQETFTVNGTSFYNYSYMDFPSFEVVNTNGVIYEFNNKDYSQTVYKGYSQSENRGFSSTNWNLTKITDPKSNRDVDFTYEEYFDPNKEETRSLITSYQNPRNSSSYDEDFYFVGIDEVKVNSLTYKMDHINNTSNRSPKKHRVSRISWDQGTVDFEYNFSRIDSPGEKALTRVLVKNQNGKIIKDFRLHYSYFNSKENCSQKECKRLRLDRIEDLTTSGVKEKDYQFSYYYDNPLPKRTSLQTDYLGYYNNNGFEWNGSENTNPPNPTLHFYKDQGIYAVLPFKRSNGSNYTLLSGSYSLEPNTYSFSGLLKKVRYPSGGSSEFEYENHKFILQDAEYVAGGARIKKQKLDDGSGKVQEVLYEYTNRVGASSGRINSVPTFAHLNKPVLYGTPLKQYFTYYNKPKYSLELTEGAFVGYSRVIRRQLGNGYVETVFSSPGLYPNGRETTQDPSGNNNYDSFLKNNNYPNLNVIDYDIRRGKKIAERIYDESNTLLQNTDYTHTYKVFKTIDLGYITTIQGNPFLEGGHVREFEHHSKIHIERNLQTKVVNTEYFPNGNIVTETKTVYDSNYPFVKEQSIKTETEETKTKLFYPYNSEVNTLPLVSNLVSQNRLNEPLKQEVYVDDNLIAKKQWSYANTGNIILPKTFLLSKGNGPLEEKVIYHLYDSYGNPLEVSKKDGTKIRYVWGYNRTLPIAKIEGYNTVGRDQLAVIKTAITDSNNDISINDEDKLRISLNALRDVFPEALITTYTYDPLIGITSMTDPRKEVIYYEYDQFNRLKFVKNTEGEILKEHTYNYKN